MRRFVRSPVSAALLMCFATTAALAAQPTPFDPAGNENDLVPTGKGWGERQDTAPPRVNVQLPPQANGNAGGNGNAGTANNGIFYHGGPVMVNAKHAYYIWYGNWSGNTATTILPNFMSSIGGSSYFNINTTYTNGAGQRVSNAVALAGQTNVASSTYGTSLTDNQIQSVVSNAITTGALPKDTDGVYFVLTSADVTASSGFCTQYCGWHTHGTIAGVDIKYSFVGNPDRCPSACAAQTTGPNGNAGADGMASIIAHELEEAATDPDLNAWYDRRGYENADKCAWTFGTTSTAANGSKYNVTLAGKQYLIQRNWVNAGGGYCSMSY